jgi:hypothetical protein
VMLLEPGTGAVPVMGRVAGVMGRRSGYVFIVFCCRRSSASHRRTSAIFPDSRR